MWCCKNKIAILVLVVGVLALLFPLSLPASAAVVSVDGWAWQNPLPQGNNLRDVWGDSASDVFAVGYDGTILHYNGVSWNGMTSGITNDLYDVWGNSSSDVFAVGGGGTILHYDGSSWSSMTTPTTSYLYGVWGSSDTDVYAVGASGTILHTTDGGTNWTSQTSNTSAHLRGVWGSSATDVFAVGDSGTILHTTDGGTNWTSQTSNTSAHLRGVWGSPATDVFAVGDSGTILHTTDGGTNWTSQTSSTTDHLYSVWGSSATDVFAVGDSGTILHTTDGGTNWTSQTSSTTDHLYSVWGSSASNVFAVGDSGTILHTTDGGTNWTSQTSGTTSNDLYGVWGSSDTDVFAVGRDGTILNYDGSSWSSMTSGTLEDLYGVWGSSASNVFAVGTTGTILKYSGSSWSAPMTTPTAASLYGVGGSSDSNVFAVGTGGTIFNYNGSSWSDMTNTSVTSERLRGVWGSSDTDVFAVGDNGTILHYDGSWSEMTSPTGQDLYSVWGSDWDDVFAVGASGAVCHYDGSLPWGFTDTGTLSYRGVWGSAGNDVFAVSSSGVISHYNGSSWSSMTSGTGEALNGVWGNSFFDVFAVGGNGTILHYPEQAVISVTPGSGLQGETLLGVTITGIGLTEATDVSFGAGITVTDFTEDSSTQIRADITIAADAATGARDVSVTTLGGTATLAGGFTVTGEPTVTGVNPDQGNQGETLDVTITGTNFTAASAVDIGAGITVNDFTEDSSTQITANITIAAGAATGARDVSVTTPGGTTTLPDGFTVTGEPTVTGVNPDQGNQGETLDVTITGTSFTAASAVDFGAGITVNDFTVVDSTQITANITMAADATTGARDVSVTTPGGTTTLPGGFTVTGEPTVTGVNPDQGDQGEALAVTITGTSFTVASAVDFGAGITVNDFTVVDSTQITANITIAADATTGARHVSVTTPGGTDILADGFTVTLPPPTITAVDPTSGKQGEMLDVVITGTNFTGTEVSFGAGITVNDFDVDGLTQITANITIAADATTGARDVSVTTPEGTDTLEDGFTVTPAPPTITSVNPEQDNQGETLAVTITGTYFTGATDVSFGVGITVNSHTVDSSTQITANITIAADATTGARDVSVTTPGGTDSLTDGFAVLEAGPSPTIASVNPSSGKQGETLDVAITGTNFTGTEVSFGAGITVNDFDVDGLTQITANITIAVNATTGARDVSITTPGGTGTLSGGFTVEKKADQDGDGEEDGEAGACGGWHCGGHVSANELLVGWAVVGLCWGSGYYLVRRVSRRKK